MSEASQFQRLITASSDIRHKYMLIGVPLDAATTLGNPGGRHGPQELRNSLRGLLEMRLQNNMLADIDGGVFDLSEIELIDKRDIDLSYHDPERVLGEIYQAVTSAFNLNYVPLVVGGDHSVTFPAVNALHDITKGPIGLIQVDAHCDLMDFSDRQGSFSGSSGIRRSLDLEMLSGQNIVQVGLRGYTTVEQYEIGEKHGLHRISASQFSEIGPTKAAEKTLFWASEGTQAIYLTVDLDVVNPGEAPGTGWPEPGGLTATQLFKFVRAVAPHVSAMDIAELNPVFDNRAHATAILAARLMLDFIVYRSQSSSRRSNSL